MTPPAGDASMRAEGKRATTKPTNADDGGATPKLAARLQKMVDTGAMSTFGNVQTWWLTKSVMLEIIAALEGSRPAQDIVAEMREKVQKLAEDAAANKWGFHTDAYLTVLEEIDRLSPTKNTAPTEAEESGR